MQERMNNLYRSEVELMRRVNKGEMWLGCHLGKSVYLIGQLCHDYHDKWGSFIFPDLL